MITQGKEEITDKPVVLGAGPGGVSAALALAKAGIPSVLIDKAVFPRDKICGDALSGKVIEALKKLNIDKWQDFLHFEDKIGSWGVRFVAPNGRALDVPFKTNYDLSAPAPGFICRRLDFDAWFWRQTQTEPLIEKRNGLRVTDVSRNLSGKIVLAFENGAALQTPLLVAADGAQSVAASRLAGLRLEPAHYSAGVRAYFENVADLAPDNFIELHFLPELLPGYLWIFPLPNGGANVGLGVRSDFVRKKRLNLKKILTEILNERAPFKNRFAHARQTDETRGFGLPLGSKRRALSGDGFILTGDAASLIDPFTGEGIGNAMLSGLLAAETVRRALSENDFSAENLAKFDSAVYKRLGDELKVGNILQELTRLPWLFNFVVNKAQKNEALKETISCMFEDVELRGKFKNPLFYWKFLWG